MSKRRMTEEEVKLWRRAVKDVRSHAANVDPASAAQRIADPRSSFATMLGDVAPTVDPSTTKVGRSRNDVGVTPAAARSSKSSCATDARLRGAAGPALGAGDPARDKLVAAGRLPIEATLDLHGMTEALAERRFNAFLRQASRDGLRCVLVITGKGGPASATALTRLRTSGTDQLNDLTSRRTGVLRTRLPVWADAPSVRPLIARVSQARQKDGGAGAYYIFLKRQTR